MTHWPLRCLTIFSALLHATTLAATLATLHTTWYIMRISAAAPAIVPIAGQGDLPGGFSRSMWCIAVGPNGRWMFDHMLRKTSDGDPLPRYACWNISGGLPSHLWTTDNPRFLGFQRRLARNDNIMTFNFFSDLHGKSQLQLPSWFLLLLFSTAAGQATAPRFIQQHT